MRIKMLWKRTLCILLTASMTLGGGVTAFGDEAEQPPEQEVHEILVDGSQTDIAANTFKGFGAVTCNNTSRLLLDYKEESPNEYWEIMNLLFNPETGAGLNHIKVELGGDVNSSSGTEPATKRTPEEEADVLRGAGWHFAADAKSINPDITVEALRWGEPKWTQEGIGFEAYDNPKYEARYQWYKQTLDAVYREYGFALDYLSPGQNERISGHDDNYGWIKYCAQRLNEDSEKADAVFDYSEIKIVAADHHSGSNTTAGYLLNDPELMELVDVVSDHYDLKGNANLQRVNEEFGKEVWYSEAIAPMINAKYRINVDETRGGVGGKVGMADLATRFINSYCYAGTQYPARMTRFLFQPAVGAFYEGSAYSPKHLIGAFDPWSGYYEADGGIQMVKHFMNFADLGWNYLPDACYGDGSYTDGGVEVDTGTHNYMTVKDPQTDDYSMMFANNTNQERNYSITLKNLEKAGAPVQIWETRGPDEGEPFDANWFQNIGIVTPVDQEDGTYNLTLSVKPYSIVTVTTLLDRGEAYQSGENDCTPERDVLALPYRDDFEYDTYDLDENGRSYLERRSGTPRYMTDQSGAFEVQAENDDNHVLTQVINDEIRPYDWNVWGGGNNNESSQTSGKPKTVLGDHRWVNYIAGIDFKLDLDSPAYSDNYAGIGVRQVVHETYGNDIAAYSLKLYQNGRYELSRVGTVVESGTAADFDNTAWHKMQLKAEDNILTAYLDGEELCSFEDEEAVSMSGRVTLTSGFYNTIFDNLEVLPIEGSPGYAMAKLDDTDGSIEWTGEWNHVLNEGYGHYNRTRTSGKNINGQMLTLSHKNDWTADENRMHKIFFYHSGRQDGQWSNNNTDAWANDSADAYYQVRFEGTGVAICGRPGSDKGTADIYIDDVKVGSADFKNGNNGIAPVFSKNDLADGEHVLKVVATSSGYVSCTNVIIYRSEAMPSSTYLKVNFEGTGINIFGASESAVLKVEVDGETVEEEYTTPATGNRRTSYWLRGLSDEAHEVTVLVEDGNYTIDGIDLIGSPAAEAETDYTLLERELEAAGKIDLEAEEYLEETVSRFREALLAAEEILNSNGSQEEADLARLALKNAANKLMAANTIVRIIGTIDNMTTAPYTVPELPVTIEAENAAGQIVQAPIEWEPISRSDFMKHWDIIKVQGIVSGTKWKVSAEIEVIPNDLVYFIDSGIGNYVSEDYEMIKAMNPGLKNETADKVYETNSWGYVNDQVSRKANEQGNLGKTQTGLYSGGHKDIIYKIPLEAGDYYFTGAFREWWGMTRHMSVRVVYPTGGENSEETLGGITLSGSSGDQFLTKKVTIPESGLVEYRVSLAEGAQDPVISWLSIAKAEQEEPVILTGIELLSQPSKLVYEVGEALDLTGLAVLAYYSDDTSKPVDLEELVITGYDPSIRGRQLVKVSFEDHYQTFEVTVNARQEAELTGIRVTKLPIKTIYQIGEAFDPAGMEITADYDDGEESLISYLSCNLAGFDSAEAGIKEIQVEYQGQTDTFTITVQEAVNPEAQLTGIEITKKPDKVNYYIGEQADYNGLEVIAEYDDGTKLFLDLNECSLTGFSSGQPGTVTITIAYQGYTDTFDITIAHRGSTGSPVIKQGKTRNTKPSLPGTYPASPGRPEDWRQDTTGWWLVLETGGYAQNEWKLVRDRWYFLGGDGYMKTGWQKLDHDNWYFLKEDGSMHTGWLLWNQNWYYLTDNGAMLANAVTPDQYFVDANGVWIP